MNGSSRVYGLVLLPAERAALQALVDQHGTTTAKQRLGGMLRNACDLGSVAELAATVEAPGRMPGSRPAPSENATVSKMVSKGKQAAQSASSA